MEFERGATSNVSSRPYIDLNEVPILSPGEEEEVVVPSPAPEASGSGVSVCCVCGIRLGRTAMQPQPDRWCFQCLLKICGREGGSGGGAVVDINASPRREAEMQRERNLGDPTDDVAVLLSRDPQGECGGSSSKIQASYRTSLSSQCTTTTQADCILRFEGTLYQVGPTSRSANKQTFLSGSGTNDEPDNCRIKRESILLGDPESESSSGNYKRARLSTNDSERDACPPGKPLSTKLPACLIGDALQVWVLAQHFLELLGLGKPFSFQEFESELIIPWLDSNPMQNSVQETLNKGDAIFGARDAALSRRTGSSLTRIHFSLLNLLVPELLSKVAVHVYPNFESGEYKSRKGRKKDIDYSAALMKAKLNLLPVNELTWPEIARRYILAVLSMEGNLDSIEIVSRESGNVFHCLQGDGGTLCGSLTGIAALEADAVILADAMDKIFGSLNGKSDIVSIFVKESDTSGDPQTKNESKGVLPEWAQALEPVRKLPTNVGARIRKCVYEALARKPPELVRMKLVHSISKEVYKGNASGPTKRAVIAVLENVRREIPQPEKRKTGTIIVNLSELIMKQCRIVLRRASAADTGRIFCNLSGRAILNPNDHDNKGLLGYPGMVSRPLDFRSIDLRLAAGAYGESHEAFIEDVREVYNNVQTAIGDRPDLMSVAEKLSQTFEELYEMEVIGVVHKIAEFAHLDISNEEIKKERDDFLARVNENSLPKAPWDDGICKVCGMDKDDNCVLLCDICDSEYHKYCLNPPLERIPEGNWYCPSCVGKAISRNAPCGSSVNQREERKGHGEFTCKFLDSMAQFLNLLETKEYSEYTLDERILFLKFLFDEALDTAAIRDHIDERASHTAESQQRLHSLSLESDLRKDFLGRDSNGRAYWILSRPDARPCIIANGSLTSKKRSPHEFSGVPNSSTWMFYESESEIENLLSWLQDKNEREKEVKDSILEWLSRTYCDGNHIFKEHEIFSSMHIEGRKPPLATNALISLERKFGHCSGMKTAIDIPKNLSYEAQNHRMYRCECLELLWQSREHCAYCHQSFSQGNEISQHPEVRCKESMKPKDDSSSETDRLKIASSSGEGHLVSLSKNCVVPESSLRPLVGRAYEILQFLKISLLDMDAALPEDAIRISRSKDNRRHAWRRFVKSANTIYQMIQATVMLEEAIKSEYLRNDWWFWSSASSAAKVSYLPALALRIYALDSVILYEKPVSDETRDHSISESGMTRKFQPQNIW